MIKIEIGKRKYRGVYSWNDMTLKSFCDLADIEIPPRYEEFVIIDSKYNPDDKENINSYIDFVSGLTTEELEKTFPDYFRKVIKTLTNIPEEKISELTPDNIRELYEYYFKPFVLSLLLHEPLIHIMGQIRSYEPFIGRSFRLRLRRFYLPEVVNIMGQDIPLRNEPAISYLEASEIFRGVHMSRGNLRNLAMFMGIYCRKGWEKYNEKRVLKRQKLFMKAPMSVVWSVFFYTLQRLPDSTKSIQLFGSLPKQINELTKLVRTYKSLAVLDFCMRPLVMEDLEH